MQKSIPTYILLILNVFVLSAYSNASTNPKWVSVDSITEVQLLELNGFQLKRVIKISRDGYIIDMNQLIDAIEIGSRNDSVDSLSMNVLSPLINALFQSKKQSYNANHGYIECMEEKKGKEKEKYLCTNELPMFSIDELNIEYNEFSNTERFVFKIWFGKRKVYYNIDDYSIVSYLNKSRIKNIITRLTISNTVEFNKLKNEFKSIQDSLLNQK